jgi:alpha,alpha-trehalase
VAARALSDETILLEVRTVQSEIEIAQAARTRVFEAQRPGACERRTVAGDALAAHELVLELRANQPVTIEKTVALYTSRDRAISECGLAASEKVAGAPGFDALLASHALAWEQLWRSFDIELEDHDETTRPASSSGCTSFTCSRPRRATRPISTSARGRAAFTVRATAGTSSGMICSSSRS